MSGAGPAAHINAVRYTFPDVGRLPEDISRWLHLLNVVVICTCPKKKKDWGRSDVFAWCREMGITARVLDEACVLRKANKGQNAPLQLVQSETRFCCTQQFWEKVRDSRSEVALAIGVSHLRSIEHSLGLSPDAWCLILEQDVVPTTNFRACILHAAFQLVRNRVYKDTKAVQFCLATTGQSQVMHAWKGQDPCEHTMFHRHGFALVQAPHQDHSPMRYAQVGQGARATLYHPELLQHLSQQLLSDWWDLHVQKVVMEQYVRHRSWTDNMLVMVLSHPPAFSHPVDLVDRDRGSGRLKAMQEHPLEEHVPFIMLDLNGNYGLGNCLHSIAFVLDMAAVFRCGVYIYAPACKARCEALLWEAVKIPVSDERLPSMPYVRFLFEKSRWQALCQFPNCILFVPGQVQYLQGWNFIESYAWRSLAMQMPQQYITFKRNKEQLFNNCNGWSMIQWTDEVEAALSSFLQTWDASTEHIGFHVRRTDYKFLSDSFKWTHAQHWKLADEEIIRLLTENTRKPNVVCHVRSDCDRFLGCIKRKFPRELQLRKITLSTTFTRCGKDTSQFRPRPAWADPGSEQRRTSLFEAALDYALMGRCHELHSTPGSTATECMLFVGRTKMQQQNAKSGNTPVVVLYEGEAPKTTHSGPPVQRVEAALSGALPRLLERSRFAQHGAALQMTPEQLLIWIQPPGPGGAEALTKAVFDYINTKCQQPDAPVPHNMLYDHLKQLHGKDLQPFLRTYVPRKTRTGRDGPTWVHMLIELYVNPHLLTTQEGGQLVYKENTIEKSFMDQRFLSPWAGRLLDCPAEDSPPDFPLPKEAPRSVAEVLQHWKMDAENDDQRRWQHQRNDKRGGWPANKRPHPDANSGNWSNPNKQGKHGKPWQ